MPKTQTQVKDGEIKSMAPRRKDMDNYKKADPKAVAEMEKLRKEEQKEVDVMFRCYLPQGGSAEMFYRKFPGERIRFYKFFDGKKYKVPLGLVRHVNENCRYKIEEENLDILDADGKPMTQRNERIRYEFIPVGNF